jgi:indolepyruvate ferredoxin oxidoreductase, alpha subunit
MKITEILTAKKNGKLFLLGNEAAVRGALENKVGIASTYPGTPSSEIGDVFSKIAKKSGVYFEFSTNEKVAVEVAAAAAVSGLRSFVFMKHVGLNVASDSFMSVAYTGVKGGMILMSTDDPSMFSSQNEQDNRIYARIANVPLLEPSNPQEIKDLMEYAYEISEKFQLPVLMRTTTRVSHMRSIVTLKSIKKPERLGFFRKDPERFVLVPETARKMHKLLTEKMEKLQDISNNSPFNKLFEKGGKIGIITSGGAFNYVMDLLEENNLKINVLKIGFSYPFPEMLVLDFIKKVDKIIVVEEVDPIMEKEVLALAGKYCLKKKVHGKLDSTLPMVYEYSPDIIFKGLNNVITGLKENKIFISDIPIPKRPPIFCPGCPHRATYYSVKMAVKNLKLKNVIYPTDIGCYTLGIEPPYETADYLLSMGSSIGTSCGFSKATNQNIISFIGDSTFFHAGIPALINAVHNKNSFLLVILDNRTTAMTGGQPHPGLPLDGMGEEAPEISIEKIVKSTGVEFLKIINPLNLKKSQEEFEKALKYEGIAVIISRYPCMLIKSRKGKKKLQINIKSEKCTKCLNCVEELTCPAIYTEEDGTIQINPLLCRACTVCIQSCSEKAIQARK